MEKLTINTHGQSKENPGPAAVGVHVVDSNAKVVLEISESIGNATNDYSEYFSVVRGLQALEEKFGEETKEMRFELRVCSELVKNHLCAREQIKDVSLIGHFIEIYNLRVRSFQNLEITHVSIESNKEAVMLVKEALDA